MAKKSTTAKKRAIVKKRSSKKQPAMTPPAETKVRIGPAKGRPMLQWVGKKPLTQVTAFPAQHIESFDPEGQATRANPGGLLFHGDNKEVLAHLLANGYRGKVDPIYIDPPFDSGADYVRAVALRGKSSISRLPGEAYGIGEQIQYTDIWANDNYLQFIFERLSLLKELLNETGAIYFHCDWNRSHVLRMCLEEVFGVSNLRNEIIWQRTAARSDSTTYNHIHDTLYYVTKSESFAWNQQFEAHNDDYVEAKYTHQDEGGRYRLDNITSPNTRPNMTYEWRGFPAPAYGWRYSRDRMQQLHDEGLIWYPDDKSKRPQFKRYLTDGRPLRSIWTDIYPVNRQAVEREEFPTQKPETLLARIIKTSTNVNDLVLDCFIGSGTTAAVAQKLGRRWIGCDINKGAIQTTSKRLQNIITEQIGERDRRAVKAANQSKPLFDKGEGEDAADAAPPAPAQLHFSVYRVNDYDLQIQHNEAVGLACEHIGVTRTKSDPYFDGTQGKRLVKIIPFNHPLSPTDLEQLRDELRARPEEERDILIVCLGKELAADAWLEDWNRLRRKGDVPNKLQVIELRTDPKYGKFIAHKPAAAKVSIKRKGDKIYVEVKDFISPSIVERLAAHHGLLTPQIDDWRAMVDCLMIDSAYDGRVFKIALSDIPAKKTDLVVGAYELDAGQGETTVAVKLIDMLGEEVVVIKPV